jgi:glucose-1-phosphate thymidylyltransferase
MDKAVILAAGLGRRMQRPADNLTLSADQARMAAKGIKGLIPVRDGRPFLDFVLSGLADAGYHRVCLVIGPQHDDLRRHYRSLPTNRIHIDFAVQNEPWGTAHAVQVAAGFVQNDPFLVVNSDNYYPLDTLRKLRLVGGSATAGFDREGLLRGSNIPAPRIAQYAVLAADPSGHLESIVEKPDPAWIKSLPKPILVSMNCWRFEPAIVEACLRIERSPRGEYEIPDAVLYSIRHLGIQYQVVPSDQPVLDLTGPRDIASVGALLSAVKVDL